jgi:hypothetical protein
MRDAAEPFADPLNLIEPGTAMTNSARRDRKAKAIAEMLAMIADADPGIGGGGPRPAFGDNEESLCDDVTEFGAALERFCAIGQRHRVSGKLTPRDRSVP